jgi:pimeloyl-ACP methyl ester carboxylesterase
MLLLPGIQGGADVFFEVGLALADEIPLVAASAPDIEDVLKMTRALAGFVSAIKAPRAHFLGSSLGGYLVQSLALLRPDLIDQLIIANGFFDASATQAGMPPYSALAQMDAEVLVRQNLKSLMDGPDADPGHVALKAAIAGLVGPTQTAENYKSRVLLLMGAKPLAAPAVRAECIMLIDDEEDPMVPPSMRNALRARFAHSEAHAIKGGGHLPAIQRAGDFIKLLRDRLCGDRS